MAAIRPFKGIRYNQVKVNFLGNVITPPYDVIDNEEQLRLHDLEPHNIIRLEYGKILPGDDSENNRYSRAREIFNQWLKDEILFEEKENCYYLYEQEYTYNQVKYSRKGIITALKLTPYSE